MAGPISMTASHTGIQVSMVSSVITVGFGVLASALFAVDSIATKDLPQTDLLTLRIGAICSLLVAGGGVITAIGGQILGAYKIYLEQRKSDLTQTLRYEDLLRKMEVAVQSSQKLEEEILANKGMTAKTMDEMKNQLSTVKSLFNQQTIHIEKKVEDKGEDIKSVVQGKVESKGEEVMTEVKTQKESA